MKSLSSNATSFAVGGSGGALSDGDSYDADSNGTATTYGSGTFTLNQEGNGANGTYSLHRTDTNSATVIAGSSGEGTLTGGTGGGTDGGGGASTSYFSGTSTLDHTGNAAKGTYSLHQTGTTGGTVYVISSGGGTYTAADGQTSTRGGANTITTYSSGSYELQNSGNAATGAYSMYRSQEGGATTYQNGSVGVTVNATGGWSDAADSTGTATIISTGWSTAYLSGNSSSGTYEVSEDGSSTVTTYATGTVRGLDATSTVVAITEGSLEGEGNTATGTYTLTQTSSSDQTLVHAEGTNARGTYTASGTSGSDSTMTQDGNSRLGTSTSTTTASASASVTTTGADYTQTVTSGSESTATQTASAFTGLVEGTGTQTASVTTNESGERGDTTYTLTQTQQSTVTAVEHSNMYTGVYTLTRDGSSDSSLHAKGWEGTAYGYTLDKTETGYEDSTTKGNRYLGFYTLDGTYGSTSTAIETLVHGSYGSTFTEILTEDGTASGAGNNNSGDYARHDWGDRSADFEQYGTNADGDYHVTAGNVETFDRREIGNAGTGGYRLRETSDTDYSFTQVVDGTETWTLTGNGNDTMTAIEIGNRINSVYILNETGTDGYTLTETGTLSGGSVDQTVIGIDGYDTSWEGNHARASYERETIGGGTWTRTGTNAGDGTNGYTLEISGDEIAGHFSASASGTNRYDLVERFSDISNTEPGVTTPGNVSFHAHGLPFRDPVGDPSTISNPSPYQQFRETKVDPRKADDPRDPILFGPSNSHPTFQQPPSSFLRDWLDDKTGLPKTPIEVVDTIPSTIPDFQTASAPLQPDSPEPEKLAIDRWAESDYTVPTWLGRRAEDLLFGLAYSGDRAILEPVKTAGDLSRAAVWGMDRVLLGTNLVYGPDEMPAWKSKIGQTNPGPRATPEEGEQWVKESFINGLGEPAEILLTGKAGEKVTRYVGPKVKGWVLGKEPAAPTPAQPPTGAPASAAAIELEIAIQRACFVAGTPLLTPEGAKVIEEFRPGDLVMSRDETNPLGPVEAKVVEEVFVRVAPVMRLVISGHEIGTTAEHPFHIDGVGWRCAAELQSGDRLSSHNGVCGVVEVVEDTGEVATVYNMRVAEYHTYFVGCDEWGFSVWAHNANYEVFLDTATNMHRLRNVATGEIVRTPLGDAIEFAGTARGRAEATRWLAKNNPNIAVPLSEARVGPTLSADELATGLRAERQLGHPLHISPHTGADFVDTAGRSFDALIQPGASANWAKQWSHIREVQMPRHLAKADFTIIDVTGLNAGQIADVTAHVNGLSTAQQAKIIRIGF